MFPKKDLPLEYLGCPLYKGRITKKNSIIKKSPTKAQWLDKKNLVHGCKDCPAKKRASCMPLYLLTLIQPPRAILNAPHKIMSDFFWHDNKGIHKHHWVIWKSFCYPQAEGGNGLRYIEDVAKAYGLKLWWRFRERKNYVVNFFAH